MSRSSKCCSNVSHHELLLFNPLALSVYLTGINCKMARNSRLHSVSLVGGLFVDRIGTKFFIDCKLRWRSVRIRFTLDRRLRGMFDFFCLQLLSIPIKLLSFSKLLDNCPIYLAYSKCDCDDMNLILMVYHIVVLNISNAE